MADEVTLLELSHRVEEQLGRYGVAGRVEVEGRALVLKGHGPRVLVDVGGELESFFAATEPQRCKLIERLARELSSRRRASVAPTRSKTNWLEWGRLFFGVAATAGGIYAAWYFLGRPAQQAVSSFSKIPSAAASSDTDQSNVAAPTSRLVPQTGESPAQRCSAVRARVSTGGSVSPLDADGWVIELMLLSSSTELSPSNPVFSGFFRQLPSGAAYRVAWGEEPSLRNADGPDTLAQFVTEPLVGVLPQTQSGIRIVLSGQYVPLYFEQTSRLSFARLAAALYEATFANYGALYARCAEGRTHHIGSWFRGTDWAKVSASMVASMGLYAEVPHLFGVGLTEDVFEQRRALSQFLDGARKFDRERVKMLLADDGGMLAASPGKWAAFTFPFSDGNRATRTSLRMTKAVGLGPKH